MPPPSLHSFVVQVFFRAAPSAARRLQSLALTSPLCLRGPRQVVPSEDYSHRPPRGAGSIGEGRESEAEQQRAKKKTMKTQNKQTKTNKQNLGSNNGGR